jgi:hypothetical protein
MELQRRTNAGTFWKALVLGTLATGSVFVSAPLAPVRAQGGEARVEARGVELAGRFLQALRTDDEAARIKAALPLLHRSLLTADGDDIDPSVKRAAWRKASANADTVALPTKVTRVRAKGNLTIGEGSDNVERGRVDDYFLARAEGNSGLPARITIFFPQQGEPKIYDMSGI